ncbi:hypothetical protein CF120_10530 [Aeromonas allosaccharophila]|nr:hypothetical protein CF120_10530 [Aeromonas allosaccharophila]
MFLNQPMITSLPRTCNGVGIHRKPAKIGLSPMFDRQAGERRNMVVCEYHDREHGRYVTRPCVGWMPGDLTI